MSDRQQKIIRYALTIIGIFCFILVIILAPILTDKTVMNGNVIGELQISLLVLIPCLIGSNSLTVSFLFKPYEKEDALRALEKARRYGKIDDKHYRDTMKHVELLEMENRKEKAMIEIEKKKYYKEIDDEKEKIRKTIKEK